MIFQSSSTGRPNQGFKKYYLIVNLVQQAQPETLVESLKNGKIVSKDQVIKESKRDFTIHGFLN